MGAGAGGGAGAGAAGAGTGQQARVVRRVRRNEQSPGATASAVHTQAADAGADNDARQLLVMMYVVAALIVALLVRKVMRNM